MREKSVVQRLGIGFGLAVMVVVSVLAPTAGAVAPSEAPTLTAPSAGATVGANPTLQWAPLLDATQYRVEIATNSGFSPLVSRTDTYNTSYVPPSQLPVGTIYWRVFGKNGGDLGTPAVSSFTMTQPAGPNLVSPANNATLNYPTQAPTFSWQPVAGAVKYTVLVDDAPDFIGAATYATEATSFSLTEPQTIGQTWYWQIVAQLSGGQNSQPSQTRSYKIWWGPNESNQVRPILQTPADGGTVTDTNFAWAPVVGAARYQIQVSPNAAFDNNVTIDEIVKGTRFSPPATLDNAAYYWRVRAIDNKAGTSNNGPWSLTSQFTRSWPDTPTLVSPADNDFHVSQPLFRWKPVPWAGAYQLYIGSDANFSPGTFYTCITNHTDWNPYLYESTRPALPGSCDFNLLDLANRNRLPASTNLYWKVRGIDGPAANLRGDLANAVLGQWSPTWSFQYGTAVPTTVSPLSGDTVDPTLSWSPVPGAERYEIEIYNGTSRLKDVFTTSWSYTPRMGLRDNASGSAFPATYTWRIRVIDHNRVAGPWRMGMSFTITGKPSGAGPMTNQTPANGATIAGSNPNFTWSAPAVNDPLDATDDILYYTVKYRPVGAGAWTTLNDTNYGTNVPASLPDTTSFTPTRQLQAGTYEWYVEALAANGSSANSTPTTFTVPAIPNVNLTAPADCTYGSACDVQPATPLLQWDPVTVASYYRVFLALDPDFTNIQRIYNTAETSLRPQEALLDNQAGQSYYWFVQACIGNVVLNSPAVCGPNDAAAWGTNKRAFQKASPPIVQTNPANNSTVADLPTFVWKAPSAGWNWVANNNDGVEARTYRIQVSTSQDFSSVFDTAEVDQTTYTPYDKTYPEGPLYWRVQARDATGNYLTNSPIWKVTKTSPAPGMTAPANNASVTGTPALTWTPQAFAASYDVEVYRNGDTNWTTNNKLGSGVSGTTKLAAWTPTSILPTGDYAWRIRRSDIDGRKGPWSTGRTFSVASAVPGLLTPNQGQTFTNNSILATWTAVPGAATYRFEASSTGFASIQEAAAGLVVPSWAPVRLLPNGEIAWRVTAYDSGGNVLGVSATRTFIHDLTRPTAAVTSLIPGVTTVILTWTATAAPNVPGGITAYVIRAYNGSVAEKTYLIDVPTGRPMQYVATGLTTNVVYRFTVTPVDANGAGTESPKSGNVRPTNVSPFSNPDNFIKRQYLDLIGRAATSSELTWFRNQLNNGVPAKDVVLQIWNAGAHSSVSPGVARLYSAYFLRVPDYGGLNYWIGMRRNPGLSLESISEFFSGSAEFIGNYGRLNNTQYVNLVYQNVLGRPGDPGGVNYWLGMLNSGRISRGRMMVGFSESPEYVSDNNPKIKAALIYVELLRRTPTTAERDELAARLPNRGNLNLENADLANAFAWAMALPEYASRAN